MDIQWDGDFNFSHWDTLDAKWATQYDSSTGLVGNVNYVNIKHGLKVAKDILIKWGAHSAFAGLEPINEPWYNTPIDMLKDYYRDVRSMVQLYAP